MAWRATGDPELDAILAHPALRYFVEREIRYGQTRALEVVLALIMVAVGIVLLCPESTFVGPQWRVISRFVTEDLAGGIALGVGAVRLSALKINGSGRRTPIPRFFGCLAGAAFWAALTIGFALAVPPLSLALAIYPVLALAELFSARRAAADAFVLDTFGLRERMHRLSHQRRTVDEKERHDAGRAATA